MSKELSRIFLLIIAIYTAIWASNTDYVLWSRFISAAACGVCAVWFVILERKDKE